MDGNVILTISDSPNKQTKTNKKPHYRSKGISSTEDKMINSVQGDLGASSRTHLQEMNEMCVRHIGLEKSVQAEGAACAKASSTE